MRVEKKRSTKFDLVFAGHITRDKLIFQDQGNELSPPLWATGGAVYYGSFPASLFSDKIAVLTKLALEDYTILDEFKTHPIEVIIKSSHATTIIHNIHLDADKEKREFLVENQAAPFCLDDFSDIETKIMNLCPLMQNEMDLKLLAQLAERYPLALDVQGFMRIVVADKLQDVDWQEKKEGLSYISYLKADQRETQLLTGEKNVQKAVKKLASFGPQEIVVTQSEGVLAYSKGDFFFEPFNIKKLVGRTGRGDTTFATYLAARFTTGSKKASGVRQALKWTAALVSKKLQEAGPFKGPLSMIGIKDLD